MTFTTDSQINDTNLSYALNDKDFYPEVFFTDTNSIIYYTITQYDYINDNYKIIANGKLNGYLNINNDYDYRFDFSKYIKIKQEYDLSNLNKWADNERILYKDIKENIFNFYFTLSSQPIIENSTSNLIFMSNGEIYVNGDPDTMLTWDINDYNYKFYDKTDLNLFCYPTTTNIYNETWVPFGCYSFSGDDVMYVILYDSLGNEIGGHSIWGTDEGNLRQFFFYIPSTCAYVEVWGAYSNQTHTRFNTICGKNKPIYYWNNNGCIDVLYTSGIENEIDNVTKEYIQLGNKSLPIKINTQKQLKINTGFNLNQEQIYQIIETPYCFTSQYGELEKVGRNYLTDDVNPGFGPNNIGYGSGQTKTDEIDVYNRYTPDVDKLVSLYMINNFDYINNVKRYIISVWVRCQTTSAIAIYCSGNYDDSLKINSVPANTWTRIYTEPFYAVGSHTIIIGNISGSAYGNWIDVKKVKIELGDQITEWELSLEEQGIVKPLFKKWNVDNSSFDGYNGKLLSEKNIELLLTDDKKYKRNTNIKLGFFE